MSLTGESETANAQLARTARCSARDELPESQSSLECPVVVTHKTEAKTRQRAVYILLLIVVTIGVLSASLLVQRPNNVTPGSGASSQQRASSFATSWIKGNSIVLIRHAERCDHSEAPCLDDPEGITVSGRNQALAMRGAFEKLGIQRVDILTSPATRAKQSASFMFNVAAIESGFLSNCKTITFDDVAKTKVPERNLVLMTHSHCIERLERLLNVEPFKESDYGSLLIISLDEDTRRAVTVELIDATQFIDGFTPRP